MSDVWGVWWSMENLTAEGWVVTPPPQSGRFSPKVCFTGGTRFAQHEDGSPLGVPEALATRFAAKWTAMFSGVYEARPLPRALHSMAFILDNEDEAVGHMVETLFKLSKGAWSYESALDELHALVAMFRARA